MGHSPSQPNKKPLETSVLLGCQDKPLFKGALLE